LVLGILLASLVTAQAPGAIRGRVVDAGTGVGLPRVLVQVEPDGPATQSDADGAFAIDGVPSGPQRLFVSVVGYILVRRELTVAAGSVVELTIPLSEGTGTYTETVTVVADRFRAAEPAVVAQQTLGSADIQNLRGVLADDPLRAVQVLPGVTTGDDLRSEFSVRGSGFGRMNLTVDGFSTPFLLHTVRAIEDYSQSGSVAMINSDILDGVTLLNGAYAQRFGNRTGAEVDFRLREGSRERLQTRVAVSGTSASVVAEGPLGGGSWLVSARQSYLDLVVERLIDEGLHFGFSDAQAKFVFDLTPAQRGELTLLAGRSRLEGSDDELDRDDLFVGKNASAIAIAGWRLTTRRAVLATRALASYNTFGNDALSDVRLDEGHDRQFAGRVDLTSVLSRSVQLDAGVQAEWTDQTRRRQRFNGTLGRYASINDYTGRATRSGAYAQLRWSAGPVSVVPGVRADRWSLTGESTASPWAQAELRLPRSATLRAGAGVYRQFPDFEQVIGTLAYPGARSERATHYDAGIEQRLGDAMRWQVTLYRREEDAFFNRPLADTRIVSNNRVVRGSRSAPYEPRLDGLARGVEVLLQRRSTTGLTGWLAYSYGRHRVTDRATGETYWGDLDQRHTVNLYVFYRLSDRVSFTAKLRAGSNIPAPGYFTERDGAYFITRERNTLRLPTYSRLDLRANRTFNWSRRRLTLFAEVMNVLNRENVRFNPPGVNTRTGQTSSLFEPLIPIVPSAGILIEF
jgi:hypothetical protein